VSVEVCAFAEVAGSVRFGSIQMRAQDVLCIASWEGELILGNTGSTGSADVILGDV